jgi:hypothetical protein
VLLHDGIAVSPEAGDDQFLYVTVDATHQARLLLLDSGRSLQVILGHARSTQTVLSLAPGQLLIGEQGCARINRSIASLRLEKSPSRAGLNTMAGRQSQEPAWRPRGRQ